MKCEHARVVFSYFQNLPFLAQRADQKTLHHDPVFFETFDLGHVLQFKYF